LLALVCILLVADVYWASQNLVLRRADIYMIPVDPMAGMVFEKDRTGKSVQPSDLSQTLKWRNDRWLLDGTKVADVGAFMEPSGYDDDGSSSRRCVLEYYMDSDASIESAIRSFDAAFAAGAAHALILSPAPEVDGQAQNWFPIFNAAHPSQRIC
jgi:hypothetical protein